VYVMLESANTCWGPQIISEYLLIKFISAFPPSPWDIDESLGVVKLSGSPGWQRRLDRTRVHDGGVPIRPPASKDGYSQHRL